MKKSISQMKDSRPLRIAYYVTVSVLAIVIVAILIISIKQQAVSLPTLTQTNNSLPTITYKPTQLPGQTIESTPTITTTPSQTALPTTQTPTKTVTVTPTKKPTITPTPTPTAVNPYREVILKETRKGTSITVAFKLPSACTSITSKSNIQNPEMQVTCGTSKLNLLWYTGLLVTTDTSVHFPQATLLLPAMSIKPTNGSIFLNDNRDLFRVKSENSAVYYYSNNTRDSACGWTGEISPPCGNTYSTVAGIESFLTISCTGSTTPCDDLVKTIYFFPYQLQ